jgi:hypothetical protein
MKDLAGLERNRETARDLFAELAEGMEALAAARQGKQTPGTDKVATHSGDYSATNDDSTTPTLEKIMDNPWRRLSNNPPFVLRG